MADVYDGEADERQARDEIKPTRFRPRYRQLSDEEKALHDEIKDAATVLESLIERASRDPRYQALAITSLEQSVMWAVKGLTA